MSVDWNKVKNIVAKAAPVAGTLLGGPAGATVGALVASALGVEPTPAAVENAIKNDPEAALKLRDMELNHKERLEDLALKTTEAELADKADARAAHAHSPVPSFICAALTVLVAMAFYFVWAVPLEPEAKSMAMLLLGSLMTKWGDSIAYFVGTTRSSATKTAHLAAR